tara:strand:- start:34 stop:408 length:375 start_codon:yes stop_codon:yes gene_type:complete
VVSSHRFATNLKSNVTGDDFYISLYWSGQQTSTENLGWMSEAGNDPSGFDAPDWEEGIDLSQSSPYAATNAGPGTLGPLLALLNATLQPSGGTVNPYQLTINTTAVQASGSTPVSLDSILTEPV